MKEKPVKLRKFNGLVYYLYGTGDTRSIAKQVGRAVRERGGRARVVGLEIYARKTAKWK